MGEEEPVKKSYADFKAFYDRHPGMDNAELYVEFPTVHKSTLRSWKVKANKVEAPPPPAASNNTGATDSQTQHYIEMMMTQTGSKASEFEGVDDKSKIILLKNKLRIQKETPAPAPASNSSILPNPLPIGQSSKTFGIDKYIEFDANLNEIRMEIPMVDLFDPEKNKEIRSVRSR
ncbi:MAG: hypothetical protein GY853_01070 [PVC group bacterium]|nr:hypothetical protein [PVC group bacterium]